MKRYLSILVAVLAMFSVLPVSAQQTQDALYIFRNDGGFNAFFFDDIDRIEYSKIDTLGVEQADYVVQEVYALDSVFRIPISAIDSVAFVTPETKYKAGVIKLEESLRDYVTAVDGMTLTLASNTPNGLLPKAGDKMTFLKVDDLFPYGFAGLVEKVENAGGGYTVSCDTLDLEEAFDFLVIKVAGEGDTGSNARHLRRGSSYGTKGLEHYDLPVIDKSFSLGGSFEWVSGVSTDASATAACLIKPSLDVRAFLYVGFFEGTKFTSTVRMQFDSEITLGISGAFTVHADIPFFTIPIPIGQPLIRCDVDFGIFGEGQGSLNTSYKIKANPAVHGYMYFDSDYHGRREVNAMTHMGDVETEWQKLTGKLSFSAGLYTEAGIVGLTKKLSKLTVRADVGTRIDMEAELKPEDFTSLAKPAHELALNKKTGVYDMLNRDGSVSVVVYGDVAVTAKMAQWSLTAKKEEIIKRLVEGSGALVPKFSDVKSTLSANEPGKVVLSADVSRTTPFPQRLGFQIYDEDYVLVATKWYNGNYWKAKPSYIEFPFYDLPLDKNYYAFPMTTLFGYEIAASPRIEFRMPPREKIENSIYGTWRFQHNSYGYRVTFAKGGAYRLEALDRFGNTAQTSDYYNYETGELTKAGVQEITTGTFAITSFDEWVTTDGRIMKGEGTVLSTGTVHVDCVDYYGNAESYDDEFMVTRNSEGKYRLSFNMGSRHNYNWDIKEE